MVDVDDDRDRLEAREREHQRELERRRERERDRDMGPEAVVAVSPFMARRVSWGAIFAGAIVAAVAQILFSLLGIGIGLFAADPEGRVDGGQTWAVAAGLWWLITGTLSLLIGGWVAGRLAGLPKRTEGALHGIVAWGVTTVLTVMLLGTGVGAVTGGAWSMMQTSMQQNNGSTELRITMPAGNQSDEPVAAAQPGQTGEQLEEQGVETPQEQAADATASAALWTFGALLLGAIATAAGGAWGAPHHIPTAGVRLNEHAEYHRG